MSRTVVVIGASGGLGRAVAGALAEDGWTPVLVGRDRERLIAAHGVDAPLLVGDASSAAGAEKIFAQVRTKWAEPDALVQCAGAIHIAPLHRTTEEQYRASLAANLDTAFFALQAFVTGVRRAARPGVAVLVSSVAGHIGIQNHEAVAAAKAAVEGLVRASAATYAGDGIRVNGIAPGLMETPATAQFLRSDQGRRSMAVQYPLGRYGQPADAAAAVRWLVSPEAGWVTGHILAVDGGYSAVRPLVR